MYHFSHEDDVIELWPKE